MAVLMDSGFWYASIDRSDEHHVRVESAAQNIREAVIAPIPVITETSYLILKNQGVESLAKFVHSLANSTLIFESPAATDYIRTAEIFRKYDDINIDFVDACIVAMAERLGITRIMTVDRRHFQLFRPQHCDTFEILPD